MSIFREYLNRHKLFRSSFSPPCSYLAQRATSKKVVAFHSKPNSENILVKYWDLDQEKLESYLPPFTEIDLSVEQILSGDSLPVGYNIIPALDSPIPSCYNNNNSPMSENEYNYLYDGLLCCRNQTYKCQWLWEPFKKCYGLNFKTISYLPISTQVNYQMDEVMCENRKYWRYWKIWTQHMIDYESDIPVEFLLSDNWDS